MTSTTTFTYRALPLALSLGLSAAGCSLFGCDQPSSEARVNDEVDEVDEPPGSLTFLFVSSNSGRRVDDAEISVDAEISDRHARSTTGLVAFEDVLGSFIAWARAPGYADSMLCFSVGSGVDETHKVQMTPLGDRHSVNLDELDPDNPPTITGDEGVSVTFDGPVSFVDGEGQPVTGIVDVTLTSIDLESAAAAMPACPGTKLKDDDEIPTPLTMAEISVWQGDEKLQIEAGTITITMVIPATLVGSLEPGDELEGFYLDPETGEWTLAGVGEMSAASGGDLSWAMQTDHLSYYSAATTVAPEDLACYVVVIRSEKANGFPLERSFSSYSSDGGVYRDRGFSQLTTQNTGGNCVDAPAGSAITITLPWLPDELDFPGREAPTGGCEDLGDGSLNGGCEVIEILVDAPVTECNPGDVRACDGSPGPVSMCEDSQVCFDGYWESPCFEGRAPAPVDLCEVAGDENCNGTEDDCMFGTGSPCLEDSQCASGNCHGFPWLLATEFDARCGECDEDADCPGGGCSNNPFDGEGSKCHMGEVGGGCETDAACANMCLSALGLPELETCSECEDDNDCIDPLVCHPSPGGGIFTTGRACVALESIGDGEICSSAMACSSGYCTAASLGVIDVGVCGGCGGDSDCSMGSTCTPAQIDPVTGVLTGATCTN